MHKTLYQREDAGGLNKLPGAKPKPGIKRMVKNFKDSAPPRLSGEFAHS
jgi:hypothetical protein